MKLLLDTASDSVFYIPDESEDIVYVGSYEMCRMNFASPKEWGQGMDEWGLSDRKDVWTDEISNSVEFKDIDKW